MTPAEYLVVVSNKNRYPDVSKATSEELLELMFQNFKEMDKDIPGYNPVDITVNVDIIRRAQDIINHR